MCYIIQQSEQFVGGEWYDSIFLVRLRNQVGPVNFPELGGELLADIALAQVDADAVVLLVVGVRHWLVCEKLFAVAFISRVEGVGSARLLTLRIGEQQALPTRLLGFLWLLQTNCTAVHSSSGGGRRQSIVTNGLALVHLN